MMANMMFGIHAAMTDGMLPLMENDVLNLEKSTYAALSAMPMPRFAPVPPRTFLAESDTPMSVRMNAANGLEKRV